MTSATQEPCNDTRGSGGASRGRVRRGKNIYGVDVGIVMVDTDLPRPYGDIGHASTFPFPVAYRVAAGTTPADMVSIESRGVVDAFVTAARELCSMGVRALTTTCGLLARDQQELVRQLPVPVASSSLLQASMILRIIPEEGQLGVLTIDGPAVLHGGHLDGVGLTAAEQARIVVGGMQDTEHFYRVIITDEPELDVARAEAEVVAVAAELVRQSPQVKAFLLECTNLAPYAPAIQVATGLPVWDSTTLVRWLQDGMTSPLG